MKSIHAVRQFILALLEREGGIRRMTGGSIFFTFISYSLLLDKRSCRYSTSFVRSDKGCKTLLGVWTQLVIFKIYRQPAYINKPRQRTTVFLYPTIRCAQYSTFPSGYPRPASVDSAAGKALFNVQTYLIVRRNSQRLL